MYFLSEQRRQKLINDLGGLTCPRELAEQFANFHDDIDHIDKCLEFQVKGLVNRCERLVAAAKAKNEHKVHEIRTFLRADSLVQLAYFGEIRDRRIPKARFHRLTRAIAAGLGDTSRCKSVLLHQLCNGGRLQ